MHIAYKKKETRKGLHPVMLLLIGLGICGIISWANGEKTYSVVDTANGWIKDFNGIEYTKQQIKYSDIPSKTATFIIDSILQPIQNKIATQVNPPLQAEQKRVQDSIAKKNEKPKQ